MACTEPRVLAESKLQVVPNIKENFLSKHTDVALPQKRTGFDIPFSLKKAHFIYDIFCQDEQSERTKDVTPIQLDILQFDPSLQQRCCNPTA